MSASPILVIFDCDGTLIDSQRVIVRAMEHAFDEHGLAPPAREAVLSIVGLSVFEAIGQLIPGADDDFVQRVGDSYKNGFGQLRAQCDDQEPMFPGARKAVERLGALDRVILGIATGKSRRGVDHFLQREQFNARFATIQTADTSPSKPDPDMIHAAMQETGIEAACTVMIGDTSFDMAMAVAAGVMPVGVEWGYHDAGEIEAAGATHLVDDFDALIGLLDQTYSLGLGHHV